MELNHLHSGIDFQYVMQNQSEVVQIQIFTHENSPEKICNKKQVQ